MGLNAPMFTGIRKPIRVKKPELESLNEKIKQIGPYIENQKRQSIQRALKEQQKQRNKSNNELQSISSIMNQYKDSESVRSESVHRSRRDSQIAIEMRSDIFKSCSSAQLSNAQKNGLDPQWPPLEENQRCGCKN